MWHLPFKVEKTVTCALNGGTENSLSEKSVGVGLLREGILWEVLRKNWQGREGVWL